MVVSPAAARRKTQRAEEKLPGTTAPVKRYPDVKAPTHKQAEVIVKGTRRALRNLTIGEKTYAATSGDRTTRGQIALAVRANDRLERDQRVKVGLAVVRARPKDFGLTGDAATNVQKAVKGRLPSPVRSALAHVGAATIRQHPGVRLKPRAAHGSKKGVGLLGAAAVDLSHLKVASAVSRAGAGAATLAGAGIKAAAAPVTEALRKAGAGSDENVLKHAIEDVVHLPYDAVNSGVQTARAAQGLVNLLPRGTRSIGAGLVTGGLALPLGTVGDIDGHKGSTKEAAALAKAQADGVVGALVGGHPDLALQRFAEHPVYGALEVSGAASAVGRGIGAAGRAGALGRRVKVATSTERPNLRSSRHGGVEEQRSYSRNAFVQGLQKGLEALDAHRGLDPHVARGAKADAMLRRAAHEDLAAAEDHRRADVQVAVHEASRAVSGGRRGPAISRDEKALRDLVASAAEGKLGSRADLHAVAKQEFHRLEDDYATHKLAMSLPQRRQQRAHTGAVKRIVDALEGKGKHSEPIVNDLFDRAGAYHQVADRQTQKLVDLHALDPEQADAARLRTFAVTRLGAEFDGRRAPTEADLAARQAAHSVRAGAKRDLAAADESLVKARETLAAEKAKARGNKSRRRAVVVKPGESLGPTRARSVTEYMKRVEGLDREKVGQMARGEKADAKAVASARAAVKIARGDRKTAKQTLAAVKIPGAKKFKTGLVVKDGAGGQRKLTLDEIRESWAVQHPGEPLPAFVSHVDRTTEASRFVNHTTAQGPRRVNAAPNRRTGEAAARGYAPVGARAAVDSVAHTQGTISAIENFDRLVKRAGSKRADGEMFTPQEAELEAQARNDAYNTGVPGEVEWVPVRATPSSMTPEQIEAIGSEQAASRGGAPVGLIRDQLHALRAGDITDPGARNVVLMPKTLVDEFVKGQSPTTSDLAKAAQAFTNVFRGTVLPTSTKWLFGNVAEMALRLALHHGPMVIADVATGRRLEAAIRGADEGLARDLRVRTRGGGVYGQARRQRIHRNASMFSLPVVKQGAQLAHAIRDAELQGLTARDLHALGKIGPKALFDGYSRFADAVIGANKALEELGQSAVVGKMARREFQEMSGSWAKSLHLQGETLRAMAAGDRVAAAEWAVKAAREIDKTLGKYNRFSPQMRRITQTIAPFLPWYLNAARFVYWTLPVGNPIKTALLVNAERAFDQDMQTQADAQPPGDLGANPQRADGGIVPIARYTPFGAFTPFGRDYESVAQESLSPLLPQFSSAMTIWAFGENFGHRALSLSSGAPATQGDRAKLAAYSLFEGAVPFTQIARRLMEKGSTGYDDSTVFAPKGKPLTSHGRSAAERIAVPWSPTYLQGSPPAARARPRTAAAPRSEDDAFLQLDDAAAAASARNEDDAFLQLGP